MLSFIIFLFYLRPLESQLRLQNKNSTGANSSIGGGNGGHNSRKDGNNNKNKAKRSTGGKKSFKFINGTVLKNGEKDFKKCLVKFQSLV